ncbi:MAG TPA: 7-cyano-7-deazaguanine synthase [Gemmataceae bacterium]|nr:7-cyano-7-deazaguanine synthase [Gemmataceae bacterium]
MQPSPPPAPVVPPGTTALAVLVSGGLDSAILVGEAVRGGVAVHPLYVRQGLYWEPAELRHLRRFLEAIHRPHLGPLHVLEMPVADTYREHWSLTGEGVPGADTPDEAVFLPGRNVLLLAKAMLWCHLRGVPAVALAPLESNPFPDATAEFFDTYQDVVNRAVGGSVKVLRPYAGLHKAEVMRRGHGLPLGLTFSCIRPVGDRPCGACNKCAERRRAFAGAGMEDPTEYHEGH